MRQDLKPRTLGGIRWDKTKKTAVIWILDTAEYHLPFCQMVDDMEIWVVNPMPDKSIGVIRYIKDSSRASYLNFSGSKCPTVPRKMVWILPAQEPRPEHSSD